MAKPRLSQRPSPPERSPRRESSGTEFRVDEKGEYRFQTSFYSRQGSQTQKQQMLAIGQ